MTETRTVRDRCGKEIKGIPRMKLVMKKVNKFAIRSYGLPPDSMIESNIDLCVDCEKDFNHWLEEKKEE